MKRGMVALALAAGLAVSGCGSYRAAVRTEQVLQSAQQALADGQPAKAEVLLIRAAALRPDSAAVQGRVGLQLLAAGKPSRALPYLERALQMPGWLPIECRMAAIDCYLAKYQVAKARSVLLGGLPAYRNQAMQLNNLAYAYADRGVLLPEARRLLQQALALEPESGQILDSLGWAELKLGEVLRAHALLERANALTPGSYEITYHLAYLALLEGEIDAARRHLARSLALEPTYQPALRLQARLAAP